MLISYNITPITIIHQSVCLSQYVQALYWVKSVRRTKLPQPRQISHADTRWGQGMSKARQWRERVRVRGESGKENETEIKEAETKNSTKPTPKSY